MIEFRRHISLEAPLDALRRSSADFWTSRGFVFVPSMSESLVGRRGDLLGNLVAFDMRRLRASIEVSLTSSGVDVSLAVDSRFQMITEWNRAFVDLELLEFESVLRSVGSLETVWPEFLRAYNRAGLAWALTVTLLGRRLSPEWQHRIRDLQLQLAAVASTAAG